MPNNFCSPALKCGAFHGGSMRGLHMPCDEAKKEGWFLVSMKNDLERIFAFE